MTPFSFFIKKKRDDVRLANQEGFNVKIDVDESFYSSCSYVFAGATNAKSFKAKEFKPYKTKKVVNGRLVDFVSFGKPGFSASHRNLCGPNDQMGMDTFVTSTECCEKNDDGVCVSQKSCRTPKATCLDKDSNGNITGYYDSYGVKECGACVAIELDSPTEVLGF